MSAAADAAIARVQRVQHGLFTFAQALTAGFSPAGVARRVRSGRWISVHRAVYRDAAFRPTAQQRALAGCLACGPGAVASHTTAALIWGLELVAPPTPHVTVPPGCDRRPTGIVAHRTRRLGHAEVVRIDRVPVTSAARTLTDVAPGVDESVLESWFEDLWRRGAVTPARLDRYLRSSWALARPGTERLRRLARTSIGMRPTGSQLEVAYLEVLRRFRVPAPVRQHPVATPSGVRYLDLAYPAHHLAIELDGFEAHMADRGRFDDDRLRQNDLEALGWTFRRFTRTHVTTQPGSVAFTTAAAIGLVPARWRRTRG